MKFIDKLHRSFDEKESHVCVGLDSRYDRIPDFLKRDVSISEAIFLFNKEIVEHTHHVAVAYKMNVAFYAAFGAEGLDGLRKTNQYLKEKFSQIPVIADCKRSEMGASVEMVEKEIFKWLGFDCILVTPWFGFDTAEVYLNKPEQGVGVYVHDSNPTAAEFQELELKDGRKLYEEVTQRIHDHWNVNGNVFVEAGATYPQALKKVREIVGEDMVILTAGIGTQGGQMDALRGLFGKDNKRLLVNSSRGIIFAGEGEKDYFEGVRSAAEKFRDQILSVCKTPAGH